MNAAEKTIAFKTIFLKEVRRFTRIWVQTILPAVITTTLYFVIFGHLIGPQIGNMAGHRYIDFLVPGLIMMAVITNSYANVVGSFYGAKFQRNIEEMLVSPTPNYIILLGFVMGGVARGLVVGLVVTIVSLLFSHLHMHNVFVIVSMVMLTSLLFSLAGLVNGVFAKSFDDINIVPIFVLTPLTYLGGVFYSIHLLPAFWRNVSHLNPILYMVNAFRYGFLGISDINLGLSYLIVLSVIAALFTLALHLLNKGHGMRS